MNDLMLYIINDVTLRNDQNLDILQKNYILRMTTNYVTLENDQKLYLLFKNGI